MLVPTRAEDSVALRMTLPAIRLAAQFVHPTTEVLILSPPGFDLSAIGVAEGEDRWLRHLTIAQPGKFAALRAGADAAPGERLIVVDADAVPARDAFALVIEPLVRGQADACAGRVAIAPRANGKGVGTLLERWSSLSIAAWHALRSSSPDSCWALPGPLYAVGRRWFPPVLASPAVDDASIGLSLKESGARFAYAPHAVVHVLIASSYREWIRQAFRSQRGWALLARHDPAAVAALLGAFRAHRRVAMRDDPTAWLVRAQEGALRRAAWTTVRLGFEPKAEWKPADSTKRWDPASVARAASPSLVDRAVSIGECR